MELIVQRKLELVAYAHKACVDAEKIGSDGIHWRGVGTVTLTDTRQVPAGTHCSLCYRVIVEPTAATQIA